MAISADWIAQNTATTGTGTITLGTALAGFIRLQDDSRITDGALVNYTIEDGNDREMGIGTYASAGGTLARTVVQRTLVSGTYDDTSPTAISLSGNAIVRCSAVADDRNYRGCFLRLSSAQAISNSAWEVILFSSEEYDTDDFHDNVTNNSRITIPSGITRVKLSGNISWESNTAGLRGASIYLNGVVDSVDLRPAASTALQHTNYVGTAVIDVTVGDYFELYARQTAASSLSTNIATPTLTWVCLEVIE